MVFSQRNMKSLLDDESFRLINPLIFKNLNLFVFVLSNVKMLIYICIYPVGKFKFDTYV